MTVSRKSVRRTVPQLNVRSEYAYRRARELAKQAGTTTTKIVEDALRDFAFDRASANASEEARWAKIHQIIEEVAKDGPYPSTKEIDEEMYDEWGVPR